MRTAQLILAKVETVIDYLKNCQEYIQERKAFEAEYWLGKAINYVDDISPIMSEWADEEEERLGKESEEQGYTIIESERENNG